MVCIKALSTSRSNTKFILCVFLSIVACCFLNILLYAWIYTERHGCVREHVDIQTLDSCVYTKETRTSADKMCIPFIAEHPLCRS